jgi:hypothetical protein
VDELYVLARSVLLDALEALGPHRMRACQEPRRSICESAKRTSPSPRSRRTGISSLIRADLSDVPPVDEDSWQPASPSRVETA